RVAELRVRQAHRPGESNRLVCLRVVVVDADDPDPLARLPGEPLEQWRLGPARPQPLGPKIHHGWAPPHPGQVYVTTATQAAQRDVGKPVGDRFALRTGAWTRLDP